MSKFDKYSSSVKTTNETNFYEDYIERINRMFEQLQFFVIQTTMNGYAKARYIHPFETPTPEIELSEVIDFIFEIWSLRENGNYHTTVYIHLCENNKYYVGYSNYSYLPQGVEKTPKNSAFNRLEDHRNNGGTITKTNFTHLYKVIANITYFKGDKNDEDVITLLLSYAVGKQNVRGVIFSSPFQDYDKYFNMFTIED